MVPIKPGNSIADSPYGVPVQQGRITDSDPVLLLSLDRGKRERRRRDRIQWLVSNGICQAPSTRPGLIDPPGTMQPVATLKAGLAPYL